MDPQALEKLFKKINRFDALMGFEFKISGPGLATYRLKLEEKHMSSPGFCHGAVLAAMMDAQLGLTALSSAVTEDKLCSTVELKTNFLQPAHLGDTIVGEGSIDYKGKTLVVVSAWLKRESDGELISKGMGTFNMYPMNKKEVQQWSQA